MTCFVYVDSDGAVTYEEAIAPDGVSYNLHVSCIYSWTLHAKMSEALRVSTTSSIEDATSAAGGSGGGDDASAAGDRRNTTGRPNWDRIQFLDLRHCLQVYNTNTL